MPLVRVYMSDPPLRRDYAGRGVGAQRATCVQPVIPGMPVPHANRGKGFEAEIEFALARYDAAGAYVQRNPTPYKPLRPMKGHPGAFVCVLEGNAPPDYLIAWGGLVVLMDAKSTTDKGWGLDNLHPHQADAFSRWVSVGGGAETGRRAGVVLRVEGIDPGCCWWVDWRVLEPVWRAWWAKRQAGVRAKPGEARLDAAWLDENGKRGPGADWWGGVS